MSAKNPVLWISLFVIPLFAGPSLTRAQTVGNADVVTAIPRSGYDIDFAKSRLGNRDLLHEKYATPR